MVPPECNQSFRLIVQARIDRASCTDCLYKSKLAVAFDCSTTPAVPNERELYSACRFPFGCNSTAAQHSTAEMDFGLGFVSHGCLCALHAMRCTPAAYGVRRIMRPLCAHGW